MVAFEHVSRRFVSKAGVAEAPHGVNTGVFAGIFTVLPLVVLANWMLGRGMLGRLEARLVRWKQAEGTGVAL